MGEPLLARTAQNLTPEGSSLLLHGQAWEAVLQALPVHSKARLLRAQLRQRVTAQRPTAHLARSSRGAADSWLLTLKHLTRDDFHPEQLPNAALADCEGNNATPETAARCSCSGCPEYASNSNTNTPSSAGEGGDGASSQPGA